MLHVYQHADDCEYTQNATSKMARVIEAFLLIVGEGSAVAFVLLTQKNLLLLCLQRHFNGVLLLHTFLMIVCFLECHPQTLYLRIVHH